MTRIETRVAKWGHSLAIRIPQSVAKESRLHEGDTLALDVTSDGDIVLRPALKRYNLAELVGKITPKNRHHETEWGEPQGRESW